MKILVLQQSPATLSGIKDCGRKFPKSWLHLMSRPSQQKRLAAVLGKTLKDLEAKADTDATDPAFIHLKTQLVQRIIQLEADSTRARAVIHLVDVPESAPDDSAQADPQKESIA